MTRVVNPGEQYVVWVTTVSTKRNNRFASFGNRIRILKLDMDEVFRNELMGVPSVIKSVVSSVVESIVRDYGVFTAAEHPRAYAQAVQDVKQLNERVGG